MGYEYAHIAPLKSDRIEENQCCHCVTISGIISGKLIRPNERYLVLNFPPRIIAVAADVAMAVETVAAMIAIVKEFQAAGQLEIRTDQTRQRTRSG